MQSPVNLFLYITFICDFFGSPCAFFLKYTDHRKTNLLLFLRMRTSTELEGIAKTFNDSVLSDFLIEKEIEVIPITARENLEQRFRQPKHNFPVREYSLEHL